MIKKAKETLVAAEAEAARKAAKEAEAERLKEAVAGRRGRWRSERDRGRWRRRGGRRRKRIILR